MKNTQNKIEPHKLLDQEKELKDLVTLCSQEIGILLGALQGELLFLQKTSLSNATAKTLSDLRQIGEEIYLLTRDLKVFSHTTVLDAELSDLSQVLLDSVDSAEKELHKKGVRVTVLAEAGSYCKVDSIAMGTAFANLILFAGYFLPENSELHISLKHSDKDIRVEIDESSSQHLPHFEEQLFHPHALREQHPAISNLCVAPSVAKYAFLNHGGNFVASFTGKNKSYLMTLPYNAAIAPMLSYPKQRKARRVRTHLLGTLLSGYASNEQIVISVISTLGAFLKVPKKEKEKAPELNQEITFTVSLHGGSKIAEVRGRVANMSAAEDYYGLGLEFIEVEDKGKLLIGEIIRHSLA